MTVPFDTLDNFYFNEFIPTLHPLLQEIAVDKRVLKHQDDPEPLTSIAGLYQQQYFYIPWLIADYFPIPEDSLLTLGKAWILRIIDIIVTDNVIDRQTPDIPAITLFNQQVRAYSDELLRSLMGNSGEFWSRYFNATQSLLNSNAIEVYCVDEHRAPYSLEVMQDLYDKRTAIISVLIFAMGELSGKSEAAQTIGDHYQKITFGDQLLDDTMDWREDFRNGRLTLPAIMALEAENIPFSEASSISESQIDNAIMQHNILQEISKIALSHFTDVQDLLVTMDATEILLAKFVKSRIKLAETSIRRYNAIALLDGFGKILGG